MAYALTDKKGRKMGKLSAEERSMPESASIDMTLTGIAKRAAQLSTVMADAMYRAAVDAMLNGSEYGWDL